MENKVIVKKSGIIHRICFCNQCEFSNSDYRTALSQAKNHVLKTGHSVVIETANSQHLERVKK